MLNYYLTQTQRLLQNPGAPTSLYNTNDLTSYINTMRGQLAGDTQCIRRQGTINTVVGQREYFFSQVSVNFPGDQAVSGAFNTRRINYLVGTGFKVVYPRPWEWFDLYALNNPVPKQGPPKIWAQFLQGSSGTGFEAAQSNTQTIDSGSFWLDPPPDLIYQLNLDCACYPSALFSDTDEEPIPYPYTDAVPFGAAWMALLSSQTSARMAEAEKYFGYYQQYAQRGRNFSNPDVLKDQYEQQPNLTIQNQLGVRGGQQ